MRIGVGEAIGLAIVAAIAAFALWQSWGKWLHPLIDAGRDLYVPEQMLAGRKLYRDILYFYPPLAPYLLAGITGIVGSSLGVYAFIGVAIGGVACSALYGIARDVSGRVAAWIVALLFVSLSLTGATTYGANVIFPYAHAAVLGMMFFLLFEGAILRIFVTGPTRLSVVVAVVAGLLAAWCKIEFAAWVLVTATMACALAVVTKRAARRDIALAAATFVACAACSVAAVWLVFADSGPGHHWLFDNTLPNALLEGGVARAFYSKVTGSDQWASNLTLALAGLVLVAIHLWLVRMLDPARTGARRGLASLGLLALLALVVYILATDLFFRAWTVVQLLLIPLALRDVDRVARSADDPARWARLTMPLLLWFSACGTSRIYLNLAPVWYGFSLILPVLLLIVHVLFRELPARDFHSRRASLLWLPLLLVICGRNLAEQRAAYADKRHAIVTPRGTFYDVAADRARVLNEFIAYATANRLEGMVIIPEGLAMNYVTSIPNPMSWHTFTPAEIPTREIDRRAVAEFDRVKPRYVVVTTQEAAAFGFRGFGVDYGLELDRYLRANYVLERKWTSATFSMYLLKRR
ncbi:MAG: hypothetical protein HYU52_06525 [Acidobacteria bacterium]|nr:hypothetical protein [Acidobacteriota bacterium]